MTSTQTGYPPAPPPTQIPLVRFRGVTKTYTRGDEQVHALRTVDFDVHPGDFVVVTGPSGAGKSTLLHVAAGLDEPDTGSVLFRHTDIFALKQRDRAEFRRKNIGFVFQFFNLVPTLDAVKNVALPLLLDGIAAPDAYQRAEQLLTRLGMGERLHHTPSEMSGGQMQRVAVARALAADAPLLLADEPTGNLDSKSGAEVMRLLRSAARERGAAVILVTHERDAAEPGDVPIWLQDGTIHRQ